MKSKMKYKLTKENTHLILKWHCEWNIW